MLAPASLDDASEHGAIGHPRFVVGHRAVSDPLTRPHLQINTGIGLKTKTLFAWLPSSAF